jgi:hypothetical protein
VDWDADPDWEWHSAAEDTPEQLMTIWQDAVAAPAPRSPRRWPTAAWITWPRGISNSRGEAPSLRRLMVDMIEEYARHVGHAGLIRESVDGLVGDDPPG